MKKLSIRMKILLPISILVLVGFAALTSIIMMQYYNTSVQLEKDYVEQLAWHKVNAVKAVLETPLNEASAMAATFGETVVESKGALGRDTLNHFLKKWLKEDSSYYSTYMVWEPNAFDNNDAMYVNKANHDSTGRFIPYFFKDGNTVKSKAASDYDTAEYYQKTKTLKKEIISDVHLVDNGQGEMLVVSLVQPIIADGEFLGVIGIDILTDKIQKIVDDTKLFDTGYIWVTTFSANLVAHPKAEIINTDVTDYFDASYEAPIKRSIEDENLVFEVQNKSYVNGIVSQVTFASVEIGNTSSNFAVGVSIPFAELNASTNRGINIGIILAVAFLVTIIGVLVFVVGKFIVKPINGSINRIGSSAGQVTYSSKQLAESSQQLSEGSTEQAAAIEETSATMDETSSMVKQNAENTRQANSLSREASEAAAKGSSRMQEMTNSMEELKKSSGEISKIIKVIDDIAFQTNMLALNAAVEAARAGDAGQGFAVVAEEVRNLAQKSAQAAKDTAEIIDRNIELSDRGVSISVDVNDALEEIMQKSKDVNQLIEEISAASDEQAKGTAQVTEAIGQMEIVVQSNAATAEESAASAEELKTQAAMLEAIVIELNKLVKGENNKTENKSSDTGASSGSLPEGVAERRKPLLGGVLKSQKHIMAPDDVIPLDHDDDF